MNPDRPPKTISRYCMDRSIALHHLGLRPWQHPSSSQLFFSKDLLTDTFAFVLDERNYPVLVWDSTQAFLGALRRAQNWSFASVLSEYRAFSGEKPHYLVELSLELLQVRFVANKKSLKDDGVPGAEVLVSAPPEEKKDDDDDEGNDLAAGRPLTQDNSNRVTIVLPQEEYLPEWLKRQRRRDEQMRASRT